MLENQLYRMLAKTSNLFVFTISLLVMFFAPLEVYANNKTLKEELSNYIKKNSPIRSSNSKIGISVFDVESSKEIFAYNSDETLTPASVVKLLTSYASLKLLGANFRYPTEIFVDRLPQESRGSVNNLYIRGFGDPSMVNERMSELARIIKFYGVKKINNIIVDDTLFINPAPASGRKAYESALSATSLNYNSYALHIAPSSLGEKPLVSVASPSIADLVNEAKSAMVRRSVYNILQTPESRNYAYRIKKRLGEKLEKLKLRFMGKVSLGDQPSVRYFSVPSPVSYYGFALKGFLEEQDIIVGGEVLNDQVSKNAKLLNTIHSPMLSDILKDLNHYSNNFIAGQLLFTLGQDPEGFFRKEIGLQRIEDLLIGLGFSPREFTLMDGSGLDKSNKLSSKLLAKLLTIAYRDFSIRPDFIASLSRFQNTGTLSKRKIKSLNSNSESQQRANSIWAKTGTLTGVSSLAGYAMSKEGRVLAFSIITNGRLAKYDAVKFEDGLVSTLIN